MHPAVKVADGSRHTLRMTLDRRAFLVRSGLALTATGLLEAEADEVLAAPQAAPLTWPAVRAQFSLTPLYIHF
jgi:hypothetical protein